MKRHEDKSIEDEKFRSVEVSKTCSVIEGKGIYGNWDNKFSHNEREMKWCYRFANIMETKEVKIKIYISDLADRNMPECKTVWPQQCGNGSSYGLG